MFFSPSSSKYAFVLNFSSPPSNHFLVLFLSDMIKP